MGSLALYISTLFVQCVIAEATLHLLTDLVKGFDDARCFTHISHKGIKNNVWICDWRYDNVVFPGSSMGLGHLLHLPVISVGYDQAAPSGANKLFEQDRYPCPHFLFELHSVQDTADFFMQNPSIMKKLNLAHFVVILKQVSFMLVLQQLIGYLLFWGWRK